MDNYTFIWLLSFAKVIFVGLNVLLFLFIIYYTQFVKAKEYISTLDKKIAFVIAHPDDEAMFMSPTIYNLITNGVNVFVLCLSNGNADGLGKIREKELIQSCKYFGIREENVKIIDDEHLQDGFDKKWDVELISQKVEEFCKSNEISTIFTFDKEGVSNHPNHISVFKGVKHCISRNDWIGFELETTSFFRKYIGLLDILYNSIIQIISPNLNLTCCTSSLFHSYYAMSFHKSQFIWFRKLFMIFSRYGYINTWRRMK